LSTDVHITDNALDIKDIKLQMPNSDIRLDDLHVEYSSLKNLGNELPNMPLMVRTPGSTVTPSDFAASLPDLKKFNDPLRIATTVVRDGGRIEVPELSVKSSDGTLSLNARGGMTLPTAGGYHALDLDRIDLDVKSGKLSQYLDLVPGLSAQARDLVARCGNVAVDGQLHNTPGNLRFNGKLGTSLGNADLNGTLAQQHGTNRFTGHVKTDALQLGTLLGKHDLLDQVAVDAQVDALIKGGDVDNAIVIVEHPVTEEQLSSITYLFNLPELRITDEGYLNNLQLHFPDDCGRHKLLDLLGDLRLSGGYLNARITAYKPGHSINTKAAKALRALLK
jgi:hypothetical protein